MLHRIVSAFLIVTLLTACGFKLRGDYQVPDFMQLILLQSNLPYGEMTRGLKRLLKASHVVLADENNGQSSAVLKLVEHALERRILSVDEHGRAREYEINYRVTASLFYPVYDSPLLEKDLILTRDYLFDSENALAANAEEELLRHNMQQEMAQLIMDQLTAVEKPAVGKSL